MSMAMAVRNIESEVRFSAKSKLTVLYVWDASLIFDHHSFFSSRLIFLVGSLQNFSFLSITAISRQSAVNFFLVVLRKA